MIALVFAILKHSLPWRREFNSYLGPVPEYLLVNSAVRRFLMAASVEGKFLFRFLYMLTRSLTIFGSAGIRAFSKIQLVVYHQCCILIGWATARLYVTAH